jgi:PAS domain S-box-containing protein
MYSTDHNELELSPSEIHNSDLSLRADKINAKTAVPSNKINGIAASLDEQQDQPAGYNEELKQRIHDQAATLWKNNELYRCIVDASPDAIYVTDLEGNVVFANQQAADLLSFERPAELDGLNAFDYAAPEDRSRAKQGVSHVITSGSVNNLEFTMLAKDGLPFPVDVSASLIKDETGQPKYFIAVVRDVSPYKQMEASLRQQTEVMQSILSSMGDGVVVADEQGRFLMFNPAAEQILGLSAMESMPSEWSDYYGLFLPDMVTPYPLEQLPLTRAIRGEEVNQVDVYVCHAERPKGLMLSVTARPLLNVDGTPGGGVAVFHDVTTRRRMEKSLQHSHERFAKIFRASPAGIVITRLADGRIIDFNESFLRLTGYKWREVLGRTISELGFAAPEVRNGYLERLRSVGSLANFEIALPVKSGETKPVLVSIEQVDLNNEPCLLTLLHDITERQQADEGLVHSGDKRTLAPCNSPQKN